MDPDHLTTRWRAVGQFRYFDAETWKPVRVTTKTGDGEYIDDIDAKSDAGSETLPWKDFQGGIPGRPKNAPESALVRAYVEWMGRPERFGHPYLREERLRADLFDRRWWRLLEAKIRTDRVALRTAVGQLLDYQRCYHGRRHPSLGLLIPTKPRDSDLKFLRACNVTAIWRTPRGRFCDSTDDRRWSRRVE